MADTTRRLAVLLLTAAVAVPLLAAAAVADLDELRDEEDRLESEVDEAQQQISETEQLHEQVAEQLGDAAQELDALTDELADAERELSEAEDALAAAEDELAAAEDDLAAAEDDLAAAEARVAAASAELRDREGAFRDQLASTHKYQVTTDHLRAYYTALGSSDRVGDVAATLYALRGVADRERVTVDDLAALRDELQHHQETAEAVRDRRDERASQAQQRRDEVAERREERESALETVREREQRQRALVAELESEEEELDDRVIALQSSLAQRRDALEDTREEIEEREAAQRRQPGSSGQVCPVPGGSFINDWHFPRSGGRLHKGNDIFAPRGTPIYAMHSGTVRRVTRNDVGLGGRTVSYWTDSGTWWYYAHLDEVAPGLEPGDRVEAGQQLGTVGNTGNARTTPPHLHLGYYPGGSAQNPYPYLVDACR